MPIDLNLEELQRQILADWRQAAKEYTGEYLPTRLLERLLQESDDVRVRLFAASLPELPSALVERLADEAQGDDVRQMLARHTRLPPRHMHDYALHGSWPLRLALASNRSLPPQIAAVLVRDPHPQVRLRLASVAGLPQRVLDYLSEDPDPSVRAACLPAARVERGWLKRFMADPDASVRLKAIHHRDAAMEDLLELADSEDEALQLQLLTRPELPEEVLQSLLLSEHPAVRRLAFGRMRVSPPLQALLAGSDPELMDALVERDELSPEVAAELARHPRLAARLAARADLAVASGLDPLQSLETAAAALASLAGKAQAQLVARLAASESRPLRLLAALRAPLAASDVAQLLRDEDEELLHILAQRRCDAAALPESLALKILMGSQDPLLIAFALGSRQLKAEVLAARAYDPDPEIRRRLLAQPRLPERVRTQIPPPAAPERPDGAPFLDFFLHS